MRTTVPLAQRPLPHFDELPTLAELPVTGGIETKAVDAAVQLVNARRNVRRFVEAARYAKAFQVELRRQTARPPEAPVAPLHEAMRRLFMASMAFFHERLEVSMSDQIRGALARAYKAGQGENIAANVLFVDLRLLSRCEAAQAAEVIRAIGEAEQCLISVRLG
jgi:hypothetical protein